MGAWDSAWYRGNPALTIPESGTVPTVPDPDMEWYEGPSDQPVTWLPRVFPASLNGRLFQVDLDQFRMTTMQVRRVALDDSVEPGEQSLNAAGVWPRAQDNWFLGAGQMFLDNRFAFETIYTHTGESPSVRTRFWRSKGLYINQEGMLQLQPYQFCKAVLKYTGNTHPKSGQIVSCGGYMYYSDGPTLFYTADASPVAPTWHQCTFSGALQAGNDVSSLTTDGSRVWAACGPSGVYVFSAGVARGVPAATPAPLSNVSGVLGSIANSGPTGAELEAGATYQYAVTKVDAFGNETAVASEGGMTTQVTQASVTTTVVEGTGATAVTVTTSAPAPTTISWTGDANAASYNIYRLNVYDATAWVQIGSAETSFPDYVDSGSNTLLYRQPPGSNQTGTTAYPASFVSYCSGYLIGSTGRDLVNILASGNAQFIYLHPSPNFIWTFAFSTPTAIHVGGAAGGLSFIGAIQPDSATQGANLAPPYTATVLPPGEIPYDIAYNAGSIVLATSAGVRTGGTPDSTGVFDINAAIADAPNVLCLAAYQNYCWYGWSNYDIRFVTPGVPDANVFTNGVVTAGMGKLDLSQYTTTGVPAYASDAMVPDDFVDAFNTEFAAALGAYPLPEGGNTTGIALDSQGNPYFMVQNIGLFGPSGGGVAPIGWMESGWTRYSTEEPKILTRGNATTMPIPVPAAFELDVFDQGGERHVVGVLDTPGATGPLTYWATDLQVGDRFMPMLWLYADYDNYWAGSTQYTNYDLLSNANPSAQLSTAKLSDLYTASWKATPTPIVVAPAGPVLNQWTLSGMVVPVRQDEIMLPLILRTRVSDVTAGQGQAHYQDIFAQFLWLKQQEASGIPLNVVIGGLSFLAYVDQIQVAPGKEAKWNDDRTFPESTVIVKLISLEPIGSGASNYTPVLSGIPYDDPNYVYDGPYTYTGS